MVLKLGKGCHCVGATTRNSLKLLHLRVDDLLAAHSQAVVGSSWDVEVDNRRESPVSLDEFVVTVVSRSVTLGRMQFVEIDLAILATSREAHIVGVPVNTHDLTLMSSETHTITDGTCVEIEYVDLLILYHAGEEMASI